MYTLHSKFTPFSLYFSFFVSVSSAFFHVFLHKINKKNSRLIIGGGKKGVLPPILIIGGGGCPGSPPESALRGGLIEKARLPLQDKSAGDLQISFNLSGKWGNR